jgi:hypothetical protein
MGMGMQCIPKQILKEAAVNNAYFPVISKKSKTRYLHLKPLQSSRILSFKTFLKPKT